METIEFSSIASLIAALRAGDISAEKLIQRTLEKIHFHDQSLNCFTSIVASDAIADANQIDIRLSAREDIGCLAGIPFAVKNIFDVSGHVTLAGSLINRDLAPANEDATVIARLRKAGGILVGMLNMDEYAFGFTTENSHYGPTRNPHDTTRIAGGSSGGAAAAVAAGLVPISLGTDTNGSIRVPAALCGIFGLKPTYGRISRTGVFPFSSTLDHVGIFARSTSSLAIAFDTLQGRDVRDPVCTHRLPVMVFETLTSGVDGLRIARLGGYFDQISPEVQTELDSLGEILDLTEEVNLDGVEKALAASALITYTEAGNLHRENLIRRAQDFDVLVRDRLIAGALLPGNWYLQAQRFRRTFVDQLDRIFQKYDVLIAPCTPCKAPNIGAESIEIAGRALPMRTAIGMFTQPLAITGLPICVAPLWNSGTLPTGIQIIAPAWREDLTLRVAYLLEEVGISRSILPTSSNLT